MTESPWDQNALHQPLVLASASPRRQEILAWGGLCFETAVSEAEAENEVSGTPRQRVAAHARLKALDVAGRFPGRLVIGADTVVALGRKVLEKPLDAAEARRMLTRLSGRRHEVHTAFAVVLGGAGRVLSEECDTSEVEFRTLEPSEIEEYVASGDPLDKAGAYGIQSGGGRLVAGVIGSYLNVVGLPLGRLTATLANLGWTGCIERPDEN